MRYAAVLPAVEVNSTFHRPHRASTFERWAASVPRTFRFSIKIPRTITHDQKLSNCAALLKPFLTALAPLGSRLGCLLVQLPPSLAFDARVARAFFTVLRNRFDRGVALEPRHASWFGDRADRLLQEFEVARVAADPPRAEGDGEPGGWGGLAYFRLHGAPRMYYSSYEDEFLDALAKKLLALRRGRIPTWCIFDNTTLGAATGNALSLIERLEGSARNLLARCQSRELAGVHISQSACHRARCTSRPSSCRRSPREFGRSHTARAAARTRACNRAMPSGWSRFRSPKRTTIETGSPTDVPACPAVVANMAVARTRMEQHFFIGISCS